LGIIKSNVLLAIILCWEIPKMALSDPLIGKKLGDYNIQSILGTGGMARVYRGYDERLNRYSAVKVIEPQLIASAEEDEYRERFLREARSIAQLRHSRVVGIYQFGQLENLYYIAMEYVEGRNLREVLKGYLKQKQLMPVADVLQILKDIADALDYAHKQNIIHRDVKPSNIIITESNNGVLTDFGLALNSLEGTIGNTFGSVHYIAPEQAISSAQAVPQSDQYSLAIVAFEMLTGRVPFDDASAMSVALKHISDLPPSLLDFNPSIPPSVEQVVLRALDKDFNRRFSNCKAFVNALEMAFEDDAPAEQADQTPPKKRAMPIPTPLPSLEPEAPTISEGRRAYLDMKIAQAKREITPPVTPKRRIGLIAVGLIVVALVVMGLVVVLLQQSGASNTTATQTSVAQLNALAGATLTSEFEQTQTAEFDAQATQTADALAQLTQTKSADAGTVPVLSETATESTVESTQSPTDNPTPLPSDTATLTPTDTPTDMPTQVTQVVAIVTTEVPSVTFTNTATTAPSDTVVPSATHTNTPQPSATFTPTVLPTETPTTTRNADITNTPDLVLDADETASGLLRYDGRTIVLENLSTTTRLRVFNLSFVLFEPNASGTVSETTKRFEASEWGNVNNGLGTNKQCLQLWSTSYNSLPMDEPPADDCRSRLFFRQTSRPFWISGKEGAYFEVRNGNDVIATCTTAVADTRDELRCVFAVE
jgi:serine/threonine protein kinase